MLINFAIIFLMFWVWARLREKLKRRYYPCVLVFLAAVALSWPLFAGGLGKILLILFGGSFLLFEYLDCRLPPNWKLVGLLALCRFSVIRFTAEPSRSAQIWLVNEANTLLYVIFRDSPGPFAESAVEVILRVVFPLIVFFSSQSIQFQLFFFLANILLAWWLVARFVGSLGPAPRLIDWRPPRRVLIPFLALQAISAFSFAGSFATDFIREALLGGYVFSGALLAYLLLKRLGRRAWLALPLPALAVAQIEILAVLPLLGLADAIFGAAPLLDRGAARDAAGPAPFSRAARRRIALAVALAQLLFASLGRVQSRVYAKKFYLPRQVDELEEAPRFSIGENETEIIPAGWDAYSIDRLEYPNLAGVEPEVGASFDRAKAACEARGATLCGMRQWEFACAGEIHDLYMLHQQGREVMQQCNFATAEEGGRGKLLPAASMPGCVNQFGVFDLNGNAWEWLADELPFGFRAIAGGGRDVLGDRNAASCRSFYLIREDQLPYMDRRSFGFRCCRALYPQGATAPGPR